MFQEGQLGIYQVKLPLPLRLNHVNCYAIQGDQGWSIIDTGMNTKQGNNVWLEFMEEHQIKPGDIKKIYLTHFHPDHYGSAGWLQAFSGAPVFISKQDAAAVQRFWLDAGEERMVAKLFSAHGMPQALIDGVIDSLAKMAVHVRPYPRLSIIQPRQTVQLGNYCYQVIMTPGHSDGHVCFYNQASGIFFSGDHLLSKITPNISYWLESEPNPLKNYLASIKENYKLDCKLILPAHGAIFNNLQERIRQLEVHHHNRLNEIANFAAQGATAYEICNQAFKEGLSFHEWRFAMSETIAHLVFLVDQGKLKVKNHGGIYQYCPPRI